MRDSRRTSGIAVLVAGIVLESALLGCRQGQPKPVVAESDVCPRRASRADFEDQYLLAYARSSDALEKVEARIQELQRTGSNGDLTQAQKARSKLVHQVEVLLMLIPETYKHQETPDGIAAFFKSFINDRYCGIERGRAWAFDYIDWSRLPKGKEWTWEDVILLLPPANQ